MHIKLKNKKIYFGDYKVKCAIGKRGISSKKKEGDGFTPKGSFKFKYLFYRKDRVFKIKSFLRKIVINKNMGWCDDPKSNYYNKLVKFPFKFSAEKLYRKENIYDIILVINYNIGPIIKGKGSAIFLHIAKKNYKPTKGCVAISKKDMYLLLSFVNKRTKFLIS
jgi:L,D-peptidoglycan transpeptidase YkuD (ErfK/YbiS/YcfS/YnhG family)|tara:strand:- start:3900 stop:4391 length:492 start_codon:yes stop_codon:yes gene_type:complete